MSPILWHYIWDGEAWQWLDAISGLSRTWGLTFSSLSISDHSVTPGSSFSLFCFFDNSVSHSTSTKWDDFPNAFHFWVRGTGQLKVHIGLEKREAGKHHYTSTSRIYANFKLKDLWTKNIINKHLHYTASVCTSTQFNTLPWVNEYFSIPFSTIDGPLF